MPRVCVESVTWDGWHFHQCRKPAKWLLFGRPVCGRHAMGEYNKANRQPFPAAQKEGGHEAGA